MLAEEMRGKRSQGTEAKVFGSIHKPYNHFICTVHFSANINSALKIIVVECCVNFIVVSSKSKID